MQWLLGHMSGEWSSPSGPSHGDFCFAVCSVAIADLTVKSHWYKQSVMLGLTGFVPRLVLV